VPPFELVQNPAYADEHDCLQTCQTCSAQHTWHALPYAHRLHKHHHCAKRCHQPTSIVYTR
jgi:hypothetical protein